MVLADVYRTVNRNRLGFVFTASRKYGDVIGFVAGTTSVARLYRSMIWRSGWRFALRLAKHTLSLATLYGILESARYPSRTGALFPDAELLSIVVEENARGTGVADALLAALLDEFRRRNCLTCKLIVGADLKRATAFYRKHGFAVAGTILSHGKPANVMVYPHHD